MGHGTFAADLPVDFEAVTPGDAAPALRAISVDHPPNRRMAIAEAQEHLAAIPPDDDWPAAAERELQVLHQRLSAIEMNHEAGLTRIQQTYASAVRTRHIRVPRKWNEASARCSTLRLPPRVAVDRLAESLRVTPVRAGRRAQVSS
ncbi:hypothetical protein Ate01nite_64860 [Actinoplanes teichomyceticus]|nr:hypothetical protein Ate01nite_64860 [Actinoplanes teichomyceticus]